MRRLSLPFLMLMTPLAGPTFAAEPAAKAPVPAPSAITWKKTVLDTRFRSEGVTAADVNKDGQKDVLNGEYWYEAPDWKRHEMQTPKDPAAAARRAA